MKVIKLLSDSRRLISIVSTLIFTQVLSFVCASPKIEKINQAYSQAQSSFKKGEYSQCVRILEQTIEMDNADVNYDTIVPQEDLGKIIPILNDYAFFIFKYYEQQAIKWCSESDQTTASDFLTFRSSALDHAKQLLLFVIKKDPNRTVAYLNLADVLLNNDEKDGADKNYTIYEDLMKKEGKANKIPERVINPEKRKMLVNCPK